MCFIEVFARLQCEPPPPLFSCVCYFVKSVSCEVLRLDAQTAVCCGCPCCAKLGHILDRKLRNTHFELLIIVQWNAALTEQQIMTVMEWHKSCFTKAEKGIRKRKGKKEMTVSDKVVKSFTLLFGVCSIHPASFSTKYRLIKCKIESGPVSVWWLCECFMLCHETYMYVHLLKSVFALFVKKKVHFWSFPHQALTFTLSGSE